MLGLNMGASIMPWTIASIWDASGNPYTLIWMTALANGLPTLAVLFLKGLSYDPMVNPYLKANVHDEESVDSPNR